MADGQPQGGRETKWVFSTVTSSNAVTRGEGERRRIIVGGVGYGEIDAANGAAGGGGGRRSFGRVEVGLIFLTWLRCCWWYGESEGGELIGWMGFEWV